VLDSGANGTCVVPVNFDCPLPHAGSMLELSAYDLTTYMIKMLAERVVCFTAPPERVKQMVYEIKEKVLMHVHETVDPGLRSSTQLCYVALDYEEELKRPLEEVEATYQLPDGQPLTLGRERFMCTEILFQPSLIGRTSVKGVGHTVCEAWHKCEGDALQPTVVLSGSNTCYPGFSERLMKEISALRPDIKEWKVVASSNPSKRKYCVWYGGSHVATASGGEVRRIRFAYVQLIYVMFIRRYG
jgi:actin